MIQPRNINSKTLRQYLTKLGSRTQLTEKIQAYKQWNHKINKLHHANSIRPFFDKNTRFESTDKTVTKSEEAVATSTTAAPSHNTDDNKISTTAIPRKQPTTELNLPRLLRAYRDLSKAKLATLVILTTMCGYAMAPMATNVTCLFATTAGTGLCVASANAINQWLEIPYDAQMARTRNRVLVRNVITPTHALYFGIVTGITGTGILSTMVNPLTALLGASNILLYTCVYTPMKRVTIANTWVGSIVGAIPPIMGWTACTNNLESGAWVLGATLLAWQFPHFNALAWSMRSDYAKAGYQMMVINNPKLNSRVSLRYSLALFPISIMASYIGMTTWWFALDSSLINSVLLVGAYRFWKDSNDKSSRDLFFASLVHLPVIMALMMAHKKDWRNESKNDELKKKILLELEIEDFVDEEIEKEYNINNGN